MKKNVVTYLLILLGSVLYGLGTVLFVFPQGLLMGGTNGIAVILGTYLPLTTGTFSVILNLSLIVIAFFALGKDMAFKTFIGSLLTTISIGLFEKIFVFSAPIVSNAILCALAGGGIIALASGIMFYVDSSSGGTDIIALIIKKHSKMNIGVALLVTDVLIVVIGGVLAGIPLFIASAIGLIVKTLGIDVVIKIIKYIKQKQRVKE